MATTVVSLSEYLKTDYHPDREYIHGVLRERNVGKNEHARFQALLSAWFISQEEHWNTATFIDQRLQCRPAVVRIPDVLVTHFTPQPEVIVDPPILVVEILSPGDSYAKTREEAGDYFSMGRVAVWIVDTRTEQGFWSSGGDWTEAERLIVPGTPVHADLPPLFRRLKLTSLKKGSGKDPG